MFYCLVVFNFILIDKLVMLFHFVFCKINFSAKKQITPCNGFNYSILSE